MRKLIALGLAVLPAAGLVSPLFLAAAGRITGVQSTGEMDVPSVAPAP